MITSDHVHQILVVHINVMMCFKNDAMSIILNRWCYLKMLWSTTTSPNIKHKASKKNENGVKPKIIGWHG